MDEKDPKRQQMEYIAISALVLVALFIGISKFRKKDSDDEVFSRKEFNKRWKEVEVLQANIPRAEKAIDYTINTKRIPFKSPFEETKQLEVKEDIILPVMKFQGMVWNSLRPQVIIDNKVYDINDTIKIGTEEGKTGIKIKDITKDGIFLIYKRKEFIVRPK